MAYTPTQKLKPRSTHEMIKDLLEALPDIATHIKYKTNMSSAPFNHYFGLLMEKGLIDMLHNHYFISPKGKEYLQTLNELLILQHSC